MNLYAESSAVLAWLLDEKSSTDIRRHLSDAKIIVASDLTLIECDRVLIRAATIGDLNEADSAARRAHLRNASAHWQMLRVAGEIVDRARLPFPQEPIRTLDALHLATALTARAAIADLRLLSLDERIRESAIQLGFPVVPG